MNTMTPRRRWMRIAGLAIMLFAVPVLVVLPFGDWLVNAARNLGERSALAAFATIVGLLALDSIAAIPHGLVGALAGASLSWWVAALATWTGIMCASIIAYSIGRLAGRPLARRLLGEDDLVQAERRAESISALLLFATRPVPVVGEVILIAAGIASYPFRRFLVAIGCANTILSLAYVGLGGAIGNADPERLLLIATIAIPASALAIYGAITLVRRRKFTGSFGREDRTG